MASLSPEQHRVAKMLIAVGRRRGASKKEIKAALETGLVESNLRNLPGGDADSAGWRQERASLYRDPTNLRASVNRFYDETRAVRGKYRRAGDLAAAVQRPAAQYRGRYAQRSSEAGALLSQLGGAGRNGRGGGGGGGGGGGSFTVPGSRRTTVTPGVDNRVERAQTALAFLQSKNADPVTFATQMAALRDIPGSTVTRKGPSTTIDLGGGRKVARGAGAAARGREGKVVVAPGANRAGVGLHGDILHVAQRVAGTYGRPLDLTTGTNHSQLTTSGTQSDHWTGHAGDFAATGSKLTNMAAAALKGLGRGESVQWLRNDGGVQNVRITAANARKLAAQGGIFNVPYRGRRVQVIANTHQGGDHTNHLHLGIDH